MSYWSLWRILKHFMPPTQRYFVCCGGWWVGEYIGFTLSVHLSVRLPVRPARCVCSITPTGWILSILGTQMITTKRGCVTHNDLWTWPISSKSASVMYNDFKYWPISSRSFRHDFAIKLLKYSTSCCIWYTVQTVLDGIFPYLALMITNIRGCVAHNDFWSSRLFSCDFAVEVRDMLVDFFL